MQLNFTGKKVLLLGGTCDLAILTAKELINEGLFPILTYRNVEGKEKIESNLKGDFSTVFFDLAEPNYEILNLNFSYSIDFLHSDLEELIIRCSEKIKDYYQENVINRIEFLQKLTRKFFLAKFGRMIYISSTATKRVNSGQGYYSSSKLAIEAIYRNIGIETSRKNVTSLILNPGYLDIGRAKNIQKKIKKQYIIKSSDLAKQIVFYLSDICIGMNSSSVIIDGGLLNTKQR